MVMMTMMMTMTMMIIMDLTKTKEYANVITVGMVLDAAMMFLQLNALVIEEITKMSVLVMEDVEKMITVDVEEDGLDLNVVEEFDLQNVSDSMQTKMLFVVVTENV